MEIVGLVIAFIIIVYLVMKRINLGVAMFIGSVIIGLTSPNIGYWRFFEVLSEGIFNQTTLELVLVIIAIGMIARLMDKTGLVDQMISGLSIVFKKFQPILVVVPSVMGALAIPGGAMLSAPMVNSIARDLNLSPAKRMVTNLLFRHIWYFVFPFTPGLILTAGIIGVDIFYLIKYLAPQTVILGVVGYITLFRGLENPPIRTVNREQKRKAIIEVILALLPLMVGIVLPFIIPMPFWVSLFIGLVILIIYKREQVSISLLLKCFEWKLSLGILGIMVFREFVNNLSVLAQLADSIIKAGLPIWALAVILPGIVAFLTGSTSGAMGITFPLLAPLIGGANPDMGYVVLIYYTAFFCYFLSPVHFCLILTAEYFNISLKETYRELIWPVIVGILATIVFFFLY